MRRIDLSLALLLLAVPHVTAAQTTPPAAPQPPQPAAAPTAPLSPRVGLIDFGFRANTSDGDPALVQEFRDLRAGPTINALRYTRTTAQWQFTTALDNVGYRDQRLGVDVNRYGRLRAAFEWTQVPWFHSTLTRTLYEKDASGALRLPDSIQTAVETRQATLADVARAGIGFDTRVRRDIADAQVSYAVNDATDVHVGVTSTHRTGQQPWGAGFGFTAADEVPLPIDQRTNDINAAVQWTNGGRVVQVGYSGSFFDNAAPVLVWDSPLALSDAPGNPGQGRMAIFPSSTVHTVSALASVPLPRRSRAHAYVSIGSWSQDAPLVPHTINSALASPALSRTNADAEARVVALNLGFNTRAIDKVMISARGRLYDFDNRTPPFAQPQYVRADQTVSASALGTSEPFDYTRGFFDVNAVYTGFRHAALRGGYSLQRDDRSYRFFENTTDHVARASVDTTGLGWLTLRGLYEHAKRTGSGFDEIAFSEISEQISLRQFDISDRVRDRVSAIVQAAPSGIVGLTGTIGFGRDDRPDQFFGLLDNHHRFYTVAVDLTPSETVSAEASYGRERYDTLQRSRQADPGPQFNDPRRDWRADGDEDVHTFAANVDLPQLASRTGLRVSYDLSRGRSRYVYLLTPDSTLNPPEQLPPVRHTIQHAQTDLQYDLTRQVALGISYWFDRFGVSDFARQPATLEPLGITGSGLFLGYMLTPSTLHTAWVRLMYRW
jgi:MtrB/PioB family decaheme-associated outer membrane protein